MKEKYFICSGASLNGEITTAIPADNEAEARAKFVSTHKTQPSSCMGPFYEVNLADFYKSKLYDDSE